MKIFLKSLIVILMLITSIGMYSQIGVNTSSPNSSAMLDIYSNNRGLLMPRLTTDERDGIALPATGLMIYNTIVNDPQFNSGTPEIPVWKGMKKDDRSVVTSVSEEGNISTISTDNVVISGMSISPNAGNYLVLFNGQMKSGIMQEFNSSQAIIDVRSLYDQLKAVAATNITHPLVFGNGEVLFAGVYEIGGAMSIAGTLTIDGGGDPNSIFIMRSPGAFTSGSGSSVILTGNAKPENIFWVTDGAPSTGANSSLSGILLHGSAAAGAASMGAGSVLKGRLFTTLGAASVGALCLLTAPSGTSAFSLGVLLSFAMWTSAGAITSEAGSTINGNVGTGDGATVGMTGTVNGKIYNPNSAGPINTPNTTTFTIFKNNLELPNSSRIFTAESSVVALQSMVTVIEGDVITIQWKIDAGTAQIDNRILSVIRAGF